MRTLNYIEVLWRSANLEFHSSNGIWFIQSCWVTLKELLSINSQTFSLRVRTISLATNRWVSSKSSMINFFPNAKVSSKCNRNCFKTASLKPQGENIWTEICTTKIFSNLNLPFNENSFQNIHHDHMTILKIHVQRSGASI